MPLVSSALLSSPLVALLSRVCRASVALSSRELRDTFCLAVFVARFLALSPLCLVKFTNSMPSSEKFTHPTKTSESAKPFDRT
jgi:hypothetical protein